MMEKLPDVQASTDDRGWFIDWVGVEKVRAPIMVKAYSNFSVPQLLPTTAEICMFASLDKDLRGTHMSRFMDIIFDNSYHPEREKKWQFKWVHEYLTECLKQIRKAHSVGGERAYMSIKFVYGYLKKSPISRKLSWMPVDIHLEGVFAEEFTYRLAISQYVTTLCPCSKELSKYGAHNQRALVTVRFVTDAGKNLPVFEDVLHQIDKCASSPIYNLLKRPDERHITEEMYAHPAFVEDVVRNFCEKNIHNANMAEYNGWDIRVSSEESIHTHNAVAYVKNGDIHI